MEIEFTTVEDAADSPGEGADAGPGTPRSAGQANGGILNTISGTLTNHEISS